MTTSRVRRLDEALASGLRALDHLGEGEPDAIGIELVAVAESAGDSSVEERAGRVTTDEEWDRLVRPDVPDRELLAGVVSVKIAASRAFGATIPKDLAWTDLLVGRLAERPFRVRLDRPERMRLYTGVRIVDGVAVATAARFPGD